MNIAVIALAVVVASKIADFVIEKNDLVAAREFKTRYIDVPVELLQQFAFSPVRSSKKPTVAAEIARDVVEAKKGRNKFSDSQYVAARAIMQAQMDVLGVEEPKGKQPLN